MRIAILEELKMPSTGKPDPKKHVKKATALTILH
jgi:hypothetical protein